MVLPVFVGKSCSGAIFTRLATLASLFVGPNEGSGAGEFPRIRRKKHILSLKNSRNCPEIETKFPEELGSTNPVLS